MTTTDVPCGRPGCAGHIVDGYCDTCGMAPSRTSGRTRRRRRHQRSATAAAGTAGPVTGRTSGRVDVSRLTTRSRQTGTRTTRRSRVGAGVIEIPPMASADPSSVVMADPSVPENRRYCTKCDSPVGRGQAGRPGRTAGFCPNCGDRFDFTAKLKAGDLVAGQYDVGGALRPRRDGLDLPGPRPQRLRPVVRAQGSARHRGPRRARRPWPSNGSWPRCATPPSWASTTSCSTRARATSSWSTWAGPVSSSSPSATRGR